MTERRIYNSWAFSENEREKAKINYEIYEEELKNKSKQFYKDAPTEAELNSYTCYKCIKHGYGHNKYKILSNPYYFSTLKLALICDGGNLCFGYGAEGKHIVIYTD